MRSLTRTALAGVFAIAGTLISFNATAKPAQAGPWTIHEDLAPVVGSDGKIYSATCSGFPGTDPEFKFWSKKGASKNLVVYFEGGGACWDAETCAPRSGLFTEAATRPGWMMGSFAPEGIHDHDDPRNPFAS